MSTLYLYAWCNITKDRNCRVDNIQDYLTSIRMIPAITIQYQQIELKKNLKLNMSQASVGSSPVNYLEIVQDNKSFYYFIDKANWKSTNTVELELTLDTVNTFASDFSFNKKTHITRQHKDRLEKTRETIITPIGDDSLEWETVPANRYLVLNPWAYENEMYDTFYVAGMSELQSCVITKRHNDEILETYEDVRRLEQNYSGQYGVAMQFTHNLHGINVAKVIEYNDLIADYNNEIYWVIIFVGDPTDMSYSANGAWKSLFLDYYSEDDYFKRIIDMKEEGLTPPQFKKREEDIEDPTGVSWNLVYKSKNQYDPSHPEAFDKDNAIECYLYPSDNLTVSTPGAGTTITSSSLDANKYYYIVPSTASPVSTGWGNKKVVLKNTDIQVGHVDGTFTSSNNAWTGFGYNNTNYYVILYRGDNNTVTVEQWWWTISGGGRSGSATRRQKISTQSYSSVDLISEATIKYYVSTSYYQLMEDITGTKEEWTLGTWVTSNLSSIDALDRTDSRILKIIRIPYSFLEYDGEYNRIYSNDWLAQQVTQGTGQAQTTHYALKLMNNNAKFNGVINANYNPLEVFKVEYDEPDITDLRNDIYESKLYNSEFYTPKFVYDSFNYSYNLENVDLPDTVDLTNNIGYTVTTTMNSRFMFGLNVPLKRSTSDYNNICLVARNNELPIYNSAYINYIRSGYNYDVKSKQIQNNQKAANVALGVAGGILGGIALGAVKGSGAGIYGAAIGAAAGLVGGLINMATSQAQADNNLKQKLDELSRQAVSVSGSDDIDLLDVYTNGNKAKYCLYECSDNFKAVLKDLFYYCGYNEDVRAVPQLNTRTWFNFIQCEPVFNENNSVYREYLEDIKQRYQEGVTVYHRVNNTYDWDQVKENWETSLLQGE